MKLTFFCQGAKATITKNISEICPLGQWRTYPFFPERWTFIPNNHSKTKNLVSNANTISSQKQFRHASGVLFMVVGRN
jgi:hypothetical protein